MARKKYGKKVLRYRLSKIEKNRNIARLTIEAVNTFLINVALYTVPIYYFNYINFLNLISCTKLLLDVTNYQVTSKTPRFRTSIPGLYERLSYLGIEPATR